MYKETLKLVFKSNDEEDGYISESDEKPFQFKPRQSRFMTSLCHVTASNASDNLLVSYTPTTKDTNLTALVDSGATKNFC